MFQSNSENIRRIGQRRGIGDHPDRTGFVGSGLLGYGPQAVDALGAPGLTLQAKSTIGIGRRAVLVVVIAPPTTLAGGLSEAKAGPTVGANAMPAKAQAASAMNIAMGWSLARWRNASFGRRPTRSGAWDRRSLLAI